MAILENIWILITIIISVLILSTDPKTPSNSSSNKNELSILSTASEQQKTLRNLMWALITCFYILGLAISY
jgi:protein translocase SecG subunit